MPLCEDCDVWSAASPREEFLQRPALAFAFVFVLATITASLIGSRRARNKYKKVIVHRLGKCWNFVRAPTVPLEAIKNLNPLPYLATDWRPFGNLNLRIGRLPLEESSAKVSIACPTASSRAGT